MTQPAALGGKLKPIQFRMLRRIPDEGLSVSTLRRQGQGSDVTAQIRTLRTMIPSNLVVEVQGDGGDVRFEITDAGRKLARPEGVR